jgi:hypothetical protein
MLGASSKRAFPGTYALAIAHDNPTGKFAVSAVKVHLCPTGVPVDLSAKSLHFNFYLEPSVGGDLDVTNSEFQIRLANGSNTVGLSYLDGGMSLLARQWQERSTSLAPGSASGTTSITDIEIEFATSNQPWVGTVYFDGFRVQ